MTHAKTVRIARQLALCLTIGALGSAVITHFYWRHREQRYDLLIEQVANQYKVDKLLVKAIIRVESGFDSSSYGQAEEIGLMQVTEGAGWDWAVATGNADFDTDLLWIPKVNIEAGTWYIGRALRRWRTMDDPVPFALAEYNAGLGNVQRWLPMGKETPVTNFIDSITYPSVRSYINKVTKVYRGYQKQVE